MNKDDIKRTLIFLPAGMIVSALIQAFSFQSVFSLIFRSFIIGGLWFGAALGILAWIKKYLPEMYASIVDKTENPQYSDDDEDDGTSSKGQHLDVSVSDTEPLMSDVDMAESPDLENEQNRQSDHGGLPDAVDASKDLPTPLRDSHSSKQDEKYRFDEEPRVLAKAVRSMMKKE